MDTPALPGSFAGSAETPSQLGLVDDETARSHRLSLNASSPTAIEFVSKQLRDSPRIDHDLETTGPRLRSSRTWRQKGADTLNEKRQRKEPLCLLDLPVDVLREIVREVTHTNDLTSLALCHSALHRLAVPHIYSRFDIVWPDTNTHAEPRSGVDALTYGLATLVMAEEIFAPTNRQISNRFNPTGRGNASDMVVRKRRGNHYAQFTKKFSLGNGPPDWVQEYLIVKEGGKMLGTLVALAVARMRALETFVWDMPTGVLRDVWLSLSSLADSDDCRLSKIWVRWHDNTPSDSAHHMPAPTMFGAPPPIQPLSRRAGITRKPTLEDLGHIEFPSLSILPALQSLSVLDIDELVHLDEMAVLIDRSHEKLRELRVGIARHAVARDWTTCYNTSSFQQIDVDQPVLSSLTIGEKRFGGVWGIITGLLGDTRWQDPSLAPHLARSIAQTLPLSAADSSLNGTDRTLAPSHESPAESSRDEFAVVAHCPPRKLGLEVLELERISLDDFSLLHTVDWRKLTSLTILHCRNHEALWKMLQQEFAPAPRSQASASSPKKAARLPAIDLDMVYPLSIKSIHTNVVSPALISFLKTTLAPNTLEVLFLQEVRTYASSVTIEAIFKGPIRRHRTSLKKLLVDSSEKSSDDLPTASIRWRRWMLNREILSFVCSGKMPKLRELGMVLEYKDWHFFLQQLPSITHLRSLYIPFLAEHPHGTDVDPRDLAMQVLDVVALRPEVEMCYMGITNKCFEILESKTGFDPTNESMLGHAGHDLDNDDHDDDDDTDEHDDNEAQDDSDDTESEQSLDDRSEDYQMSQARLRLREILFYDDKVAVFRARHGRL